MVGETTYNLPCLGLHQASTLNAFIVKLLHGAYVLYRIWIDCVRLLYVRYSDWIHHHHHPWSSIRKPKADPSGIKHRGRTLHITSRAARGWKTHNHLRLDGARMVQWRTIGIPWAIPWACLSATHRSPKAHACVICMAGSLNLLENACITGTRGTPASAIHEATRRQRPQRSIPQQPQQLSPEQAFLSTPSLRRELWQGNLRTLLEKNIEIHTTGTVSSHQIRGSPLHQIYQIEC